MKPLAYTEFRIRLLFAIYLSFLAFFSVVSFFDHKYLILAVMVLFFIMLVGLLFFIRRSGLTNWIKWTFTLITWPFVCFLVIDGGHQNTAYLWSIPIFISLLHVAGFFIGFVTSVLYLSSILLLELSGFVDYPISDRFYAVSLAVIFLSTIHEYLVQLQSRALTEHIEVKKKQSETDPLTGLLNRRFIDEKIATWNRDKTNRCKALMIVDIDHFKEVNDNLGHTEGDRILGEVSKAISSVVRPSDLIGRWGGDEFLVFLEEVQTSDLTAICDRLLARVREIKLSPNKSITVSIGAVTASKEFQRMFGDADAVLYFAKQNGRNQYSIKTLD